MKGSRKSGEVASRVIRFCRRKSAPCQLSIRCILPTLTASERWTAHVLLQWIPPSSNTVLAIRLSMPPNSRKPWRIVDIFSYDLPHHIYDSHVYPRKSSNGSTVIIYGNETGLRVVWYAGRRFKAPLPAPKVNGHGTNNAMVVDLDSDDGEPEAPKKAEFEEELDEIDAQAPYYGVLRHVDIPLGSAALQLAVPHLPAEPGDSAPSLLRTKIVVAAACADYCIRAITIPLDPPAPGVTDPSKIGTQVIQLPAPNTHQDLISSVALTYTTEGLDYANDDQAEAQGEGNKYSFLVASTSSTGSGLLVIHQIATSGAKLAGAVLFRRTALRSPMMAAKISFNTAAPPAERHSELLIVIPDAPCVKVYQVYPQRVRHRRGSNATNESTSTSRSSIAASSGGKFLVTLLPEFQAARKDEKVRRKRVLDAKWISAGRAVIALLEDHEWGVWDLDAAGPTGSESVIRGQNNVTGIVGGGWTKFAIRGSGQSTTRASRDKDNYRSKDASKPLSGEPSQESQSPGGVICVAPSPAKRNDESVILCSGGQAQYVSSIATYWKSRITGKGALQSYDRPTILPSLQTGGEPVKHISILPNFPSEAVTTALEAQSLPNFLVATSSRLILHVRPLAEPDEVDEEEDVKAHYGDQSLLESNNLDLDGVDRYLEDMQKSQYPPQPQQSRGLPRARPNFGSSMMSHDGDVDMGMDSPTPAKIPQLSLAPKLSEKSTPRRLFS